MTTRLLTLLLVAGAFAMGGCTTLSDYGSVRKEALHNAEGHVVGYKQLMRNERTGEVIAQVTMYAPLRGHDGAIIGYEELARDGTIIRDLDGRSIGGRFADLRSRGTNARSKGLMIVIRSADSPKVAAVSQPKIWQLMASLSASDLRRVQ